MRAGFTLLELLVVIAVIALMTGILLPSLAGARTQARAAVEMAGVRQLMQGYIGYAMDSRGRLILGHVDEVVELTDDMGNPLSPAEVSKRWPWRLVGWVGGGVRGTILVNERANALADRQMPMWTYMVSLTPSFGLNYFNLGGDMTGGGANNTTGVLRELDHAIAPDRMLVFAGSRFAGESGPVQGYFKIVAPTRAFEYSAMGWTQSTFKARGEPGAWGYVDARANGRVVTGQLDGHCDLLSIEQLRDMRRWSNVAMLQGDPDWRE